MAVVATRPLAPVVADWPRGTAWRRLRVGLAGAALDRRLATGDDPCTDAALACRAAQLVSERSRRRVAGGLERLWSEHHAGPALSAAIPVDRRALRIGRPALQQLARALRFRDCIQPRGVALTRFLLSEPESALYLPAYPEELYERAREALFALGSDEVAVETAAEARSMARW